MVLYLMLLSPLGMALAAGWAANPNASIGVSRKLIMALGYEVPFLLAILAAMVGGGTTSLVEFGGKYLAIAALQSALHLYIVIALFVNLFLGGGANVGTFLAKMLVVFLIGLFINAVFPRFRIEQGLRFCWRWPALLGLVGLIVVLLVGS